MEKMEKVVIGKDVKALLSVIDKDEPRIHFRGVLIDGENVWATDTKILARIKLQEIDKEEIPASIKTGADTGKVWIYADSLNRALSNIPKKPALPMIQNNIYLNKENGKIELQTIDQNMVPATVQEPTSESNAENFPDCNTILDTSKDTEKTEMIFGGQIILQLAEMVKTFKNKNKFTRIVMKLDTPERAVNFQVKQNDKVLVDGCFMLCKSEEKEEEK